MERADLHFKPTDIPVFTNQIPGKPMNDLSYFQHYFPKYYNKLQVHYEERTDWMAQLTTLHAIEKQIAKTNEKIKLIINHFGPLLDITEAFLRSVPKRRRLPIENFRLNELREAIVRRSVESIQRNCSQLISEFEAHNDEFIDKGFLSIILNDFQLLMYKLKNAETERKAVTRLREQFS